MIQLAPPLPFKNWIEVKIVGSGPNSCVQYTTTTTSLRKLSSKLIGFLRNEEIIVVLWREILAKILNAVML